MERNLMIGGFGGQGVMLSGQLICYSVAETTDKQVSFFPAYGPEQRGGTSNCFVTISDSDIGTPIAGQVDELIAFNTASLVKFESKVRKGGTIFINTDTAQAEKVSRADDHVVCVPACEIAIKQGNEKAQNMAMIGAYIGYTRYLEAENILKTVEKELGKKHPETIPINRSTFMEGMRLGQDAREKISCD